MTDASDVPGTPSDTLIPTEIKIRRESRVLEIAFSNAQSFTLPFEYLRVFSPSAEVRGHGAKSFDTMQWPEKKQEVRITKIVPVGCYAIQLHFDDGHNTGLYTWELLYELGMQQTENWAEYQRRFPVDGLASHATGHATGNTVGNSTDNLTDKPMDSSMDSSMDNSPRHK